MIKAIITDIEGTTSDIRFVHHVLFPYARERLAGYVRRHGSDGETSRALSLLRQEINQSDADIETLIAALFAFMDEDRKSTALKTVQGLIWREGYLQGDFLGHVYPDVAPKLTQWRQSGLDLYVYSSGSVQAQKLLFGYSEAGDLRSLFSGYFDTRVGAKRDPASYRAIARETGLPPGELLFLSDIMQELEAASLAGWRVCQLVRDEPDPQRLYPQVNRFDHIDLQELAQ